MYKQNATAFDRKQNLAHLLHNLSADSPHQYKTLQRSHLCCTYTTCAHVRSALYNAAPKAASLSQVRFNPTRLGKPLPPPNEQTCIPTIITHTPCMRLHYNKNCDLTQTPCGVHYGEVEPSVRGTEGGMLEPFCCWVAPLE